MVFQILALGPHWFQRLSSAEFPDPCPVSRPRMPPSPEDDDDVDAPGDARFCKAAGTAEVSCDNVDCVLVPAALPLAWLTAADCATNAPGLVFCAGTLNGVSWVAAADAPA